MRLLKSGALHVPRRSFRLVAGCCCSARRASAQAAVTPVPVGQPPGPVRQHQARRASAICASSRPVTRCESPTSGPARSASRTRTASVACTSSSTGTGWAPRRRTASWTELVRGRHLPPLTHIRRSQKDGASKVEGFVFKPDRIVGPKDLAGNAAKDFEVASPQPSFNFETDMEFLQALPLAAGYEASIVFTHPRRRAAGGLSVQGGGVGGAGPAGRRQGRLLGGRPADYNHPEMPITRFWFAKGSQVMIKQLSPLPDGSGVLGKTLLASALEVRLGHPAHFPAKAGTQADFQVGPCEMARSRPTFPLALGSRLSPGRAEVRNCLARRIKSRSGLHTRSPPCVRFSSPL